MDLTTKSKKSEKEKSKKSKVSVVEKKVEKKIQNLKESNEELLKQIETLKDEKLRLLADLDNQKKGFFQEIKKMSEILKYNVSKELIEKILPLFDSYERALKISQNYQDPKIEQF